MAKEFRARYSKTGNGSKEETGSIYKNICITEIVKYFGLHKTVKYIQTTNDVVRALRNGYTVRSRQSTLGRNTTVSQLKKKLAKGPTEKGFYYVSVNGHGLLLDHEGLVRVDTDPRKSDRRKVVSVFIIY